VNESDQGSIDGRIVGGVLLAVAGAALFWAWRENAPLARYYRRRMGSWDDRTPSRPNPEADSGTNPV
jgi:hypothetical protein